MKTPIVSLINYKGGVGKTTTAVNIAANLARYHDKKVLLVDTDPQTNATVCVMNPQKRYYPNYYEKNGTMIRIFAECGQKEKSYEIDDLIVKSVVEKDDKKVLPNLDLLPSDPRLINAERWLTAVNAPYVVLWKELRKVKSEHDYDYIILDCAPNLYALTKNCIIASDYYIVPIIPDYLSSIGLELLVKWISDFGEEMEDVKPKPIELGGVFFTKYRTITRLHRDMVTEIESRLEVRGFPEVGIPPGEVKPYETIIRDLIAAAEAADHNLPLCIYRPSSESAGDFRSLTDEFVGRV